MYDNLGRISTLTTLRGVTSYVYNGKKTTVTSPTDIRETTLNSEGWVETAKVDGKSVTFNYYPLVERRCAVREEPIFT